MSRLLVLSSLLLLTGSAAAQLDRRSRDEPEVFVEAGGRTGTCDALLFSPDGKYLLAGATTSVHVARRGQGPETGRMARSAGQPGAINAVESRRSPCQPTPAQRVLVAGYGLASGLVVLLDGNGEIIATNEIEQKLPNATIMASTFAPDGKSGSGSGDGRLWSWISEPRTRDRPICDDRGRNSFGRMIRFISESHHLGCREWSGLVGNRMVKPGRSNKSSGDRAVRAALLAIVWRFRGAVLRLLGRHLGRWQSGLPARFSRIISCSARLMERGKIQGSSISFAR